MSAVRFRHWTQNKTSTYEVKSKCFFVSILQCHQNVTVIGLRKTIENTTGCAIADIPLLPQFSRHFSTLCCISFCTLSLTLRLYFSVFFTSLLIQMHLSMHEFCISSLSFICMDSGFLVFSREPPRLRMLWEYLFCISPCKLLIIPTLLRVA